MHTGCGLCGEGGSDNGHTGDAIGMPLLGKAQRQGPLVVEKRRDGMEGIPMALSAGEGFSRVTLSEVKAW